MKEQSSEYSLLATPVGFALITRLTDVTRAWRQIATFDTLADARQVLQALGGSA